MPKVQYRPRLYVQKLVTATADLAGMVDVVREDWLHWLQNQAWWERHVVSML